MTLGPREVFPLWRWVCAALGKYNDKILVFIKIFRANISYSLIGAVHRYSAAYICLLSTFCILYEDGATSVSSLFTAYSLKMDLHQSPLYLLHIPYSMKNFEDGATPVYSLFNCILHEDRERATPVSSLFTAYSIKIERATPVSALFTAYSMKMELPQSPFNLQHTYSMKIERATPVSSLFTAYSMKIERELDQSSLYLLHAL